METLNGKFVHGHKAKPQIPHGARYLLKVIAAHGELDNRAAEAKKIMDELYPDVHLRKRETRCSIGLPSRSMTPQGIITSTGFAIE